MSSKIEPRWALEYNEREDLYKVYHTGNRGVVREFGDPREASRLVGEKERMRRTLLTPGKDRLVVVLRYCRGDYHGAPGEKARAHEADSELLASDGRSPKEQASLILAEHLWGLIEVQKTTEEKLLEIQRATREDTKIPNTIKKPILDSVQRELLKVTDRLRALWGESSKDQPKQNHDTATLQS